MRGEQLRSLGDGQRQVGRAHLRQRAVDPPPVQRQRRVPPAGQHQVQAAHAVADQRLQLGQGGRVADLAHVVDDHDVGPVERVDGPRQVVLAQVALRATGSDSAPSSRPGTSAPPGSARSPSAPPASRRRFARCGPRRPARRSCPIRRARSPASAAPAPRRPAARRCGRAARIRAEDPAPPTSTGPFHGDPAVPALATLGAPRFHTSPNVTSKAPPAAAGPHPAWVVFPGRRWLFALRSNGSIDITAPARRAQEAHPERMTRGHHSGRQRSRYRPSLRRAGEGMSPG